MHCPLPSFSFLSNPANLDPYTPYHHTTTTPSTASGTTYTLTTYPSTPPTLLVPRLTPATIAITTVLPIPRAVLSLLPRGRLRLIAIWATGTEWLDTASCRELGIWVIHCPGTNIEAVSEHALGFYFHAKRKMGELDGVVKGLAGAWVERGTLTGRWGAGPPLSCREEVVGVVGFGRLGRRIARLCEGVGMGRVVVAGRKKRMGELDGEVNGMGVAGELNGDVVHRVPFEDVLRMVTVLVICCPRHASTIDLIGEEELRMMRQEAIVINVARGGIVNEAALAKALTDGWIAAAATDVLEKEPGGRGTTPLLPLEGEVPNLTITPHVAWYSAQTMKNLKTVLKEGIEAWIAGMPINVVVQGR